MMVVPKGGLPGQKLFFFQVRETEPNQFEAVLKSFIKRPAQFEEIVEKIKKCCQNIGTFIRSDMKTRQVVFIVTDQEQFMERAMIEGLIFRR